MRAFPDDAENRNYYSFVFIRSFLVPARKFLVRNMHHRIKLFNVGF